MPKIIAGVVLSDDTIVTDASFASSMRDAEAEFTFSLHHADFSSTLKSSQLDSSNILVATLSKKIPSSSFRPVCVPPQNYVNKMVKSQSCKKTREQKITEVRPYHNLNLDNHNILR